MISVIRVSPLSGVIVLKGFKVIAMSTIPLCAGLSGFDFNPTQTEYMRPLCLGVIGTESQLIDFNMEFPPCTGVIVPAKKQINRTLPCFPSVWGYRQLSG